MPRVLVVDDDRATVAVFRMILESAGYEVQEAFGGKQALETIRRDPPDAVLCDLVMEPIGGLRVARTIRDWGIPIRMIAVTGGEESTAAAVEAGFDALLYKPVSGTEILWAVGGGRRQDAA